MVVNRLLIVLFLWGNFYDMKWDNKSLRVELSFFFFVALHLKMSLLNSMFLVKSKMHLQLNLIAKPNMLKRTVGSKKKLFL